jgi:hypothetical protein
MTACWRGEPVEPTAPVPTVTTIEADRRPQALTPELVYQTISTTYMPQLRRCYQLFMKKNAQARGRVMLGFTVAATGKVTDAHADGIAPEITGCIIRRMMDWRFAPLRDLGEATFQIPLQLESN